MIMNVFCVDDLQLDLDIRVIYVSGQLNSLLHVASKISYDFFWRHKEDAPNMKRFSFGKLSLLQEHFKTIL